MVALFADDEKSVLKREDSNRRKGEHIPMNKRLTERKLPKL